MLSRRSRKIVFVAVAVITILGTPRLDEPLPPPLVGQTAAGGGFLGHYSDDQNPGEWQSEHQDEQVEAAGEASTDTPIAPPPERFDDPPPPAAQVPKQLRRGASEGTVPAKGTWAVIVGVNDYPGSGHDLGFAVADANDVDLALSRLGVPSDNRLVLRDGQASAGNIRSAVEWLVHHAGPDAVAVFFFAGHVRKLDATSEALVGSDGGIVTDSELGERLSHLEARRAWVAIAACYSGGFTEVLAPGRVLTAAASSNDLAYENERLGRSYLVEYMVRRAIIDGRAPATVQSAFVFARGEISRDYPSRVPVQFDSQGTGLDLRPPGGATAKSPAPPPPAPAGSSPGTGPGSPNPPKKKCLLVLTCG